MATEKQRDALQNWLQSTIKDGESIGEMPSEACSEALSRLSVASNEFKEGKGQRGIVSKTKREVADGLRQQGWIHESEKKEPHQEDVEPDEQEPKTTIKEYVDIIGAITETVEAEERIPPREKGYAVNMVFNAITRDMRSELIAKLGKESRGCKPL